MFTRGFDPTTIRKVTKSPLSWVIPLCFSGVFSAGLLWFPIVRVF